jgi:hypothetical protein
VAAAAAPADLMNVRRVGRFVLAMACKIRRAGASCKGIGDRE